MEQASVKSMALTMGGREWTMLVILAMLWGASFFFFKVMLQELPPFAVVLGRVGLAAIILNAWLFLRKDYMTKSAAIWRDLLIMGLINNVVPFSLIVFAEQRISSGLASILNATTPIFTVIAAHWFTSNEKLSGNKIFGVILGFSGVAVLIGPDAIFRLNGSDIIGDIGCLLAALSYAFAGIFGRRFKGMNPIKVATGQITASTIVLLPIVAIVEKPWVLPMPSMHVWAAMFGIALLSTVIAYIIYFKILATAGATNLLLVTFLLPISASFLGWGFLDERIALRSFVGMAIIGLSLAAIDGRLLKSAKRIFPSSANFTRQKLQKSAEIFNDGTGI